MIDFEDSVVDRCDFTENTEKRLPRRPGPVKQRLRELFYYLLRFNSPARRTLRQFSEHVLRSTTRRRLLVIGGGEIGWFTEDLFSDPQIACFSTDIYFSERVDLACDAHKLPFDNESFDAVLIQSVLEHVIAPSQVVEEIWRILSPSGIVYAETSFVQQVHEGAYDFMRFTHSGHRYLFRHFEELGSGALSGPGFALNWAIRYFVGAVTGSKKVGALAGVLTAFLQIFDNLIPQRLMIDGASEVYFLGIKTDTLFNHKELIEYYRMSTRNNGGSQ